ncbi:hypothetical protein K2173_009133 [Erythroxylum novogranatense]|uniref:HMA domain-containing protein n=1 Tax=Erythroxylum novogranatense TaxID=1862640 RepID=A0AAV8TKA2_9ROSI|nr:hypothetical protein K2173_009133 [Erythroxylum novogranatense]
MHKINANSIDSSLVLSSLSHLPYTTSSLSLRCLMVPELEKPRVTEIQVRMDCNGCVQKIKKALHGINGIYDLYIDFPQQKLTIIGWADPEKIVKAIRKTRKMATICSHSESTEPAAQPPEQSQQPSEGGSPPPSTDSDTANPPPAAESSAAAPPTEPPKDPPSPPENPLPEEKPSSTPPAASDKSASQSNQQRFGPKDVGEVHVIYHHPPPSDYGSYRYGYGHSYNGHWNRYASTGPGFSTEPPQPIYVTHSYNTYRPSSYVTSYEYIQSPPRRTFYNSKMDRYNDDYHDNNRNGNITSMFSDENPNACRIV